EAKKILSHEQVVIRFIATKELWDSVVDRSLMEFPSSKMEVAAPEGIPEVRFSSVKKMIFEKAAAFQALCSEALHYPRLVENLVANFRRLPGTFNATGLRGSFKGIPAVVCGAGP